MTRVKRGAVARKRREKILKISSGFQGSSSSLFRVANQHALKALKTSYADRRYKKRDFRGVWISRINAKIRTKSCEFKNYNIFMHHLKESSVGLNRKVLATLALKDYSGFLQLQEFINKTTSSLGSSSSI